MNTTTMPLERWQEWHASLAERKEESSVDFLNASRSVPAMFVDLPLTRQASGGRELIDLRELGLFQKILGAEQGYHTEADALVTQTADGVDLNALWAEFQQTLEIFNARRSALVQLLTFNVTDPIERVPQVGSVDFEDASEFGVPKSVRIVQSYFSLGYDFRDYDLALRYTWKYLRDHDARAVQAQHNAVLEGHNRLVFRRVMEAIFDNRNRLADINNDNIPVYALYNADGTVPPSYKGTTFDGTHTHYLVSNGTADGGGKVHVDSEDLDTMKQKIAEHGYGTETGTQFVLLVNSVERHGEVRLHPIRRVAGSDRAEPHRAHRRSAAVGVERPHGDRLVQQRADHRRGLHPGQLPVHVRHRWFRESEQPRWCSPARERGLPRAATAAGEPERLPAG
jgi:hypothetical protein